MSNAAKAPIMAAFDTHVQPTIACTAADSAAPNATNAAGVRASGSFPSDPVMCFTACWYRPVAAAPILHSDAGKKSVNVLMKLPETVVISVSSPTALQQESQLCIPRKEIERPQSPIPNSCVCEQCIYYRDRSTYFPVAG